MNTQGHLNAKVAGLRKVTMVNIGIALVGIFIYISYVNPRARESVASGIYLIISVGVLTLLVTMNLVYFSFKIKGIYPGLARGIPFAFWATTFCYLQMLPMLHVYPFSAERTISYLLVSLAVSLILNVVGHALYGRRSSLR